MVQEPPRPGGDRSAHAGSARKITDGVL